VRVKVEVDADGGATPILRTSSGNPEIDRRVLEALRRWRWKPALRDGEPVKSTLLFKFEFLVQ
jgi:protein TonB